MNSLRFDWAADVFGAEAVREARERPAIRHFEGPGENKPWNRGCDARGPRRGTSPTAARTPWPGRRLSATIRARRMGRAARRFLVDNRP